MGRYTYPRLQQLVFCYYNMKLKISDMEAETDKVAEKNYLDLLDISFEFGEEEENQLFQWVRPLHLDDEDENPDPRIAAHVREVGVDVDLYLKKFIVKVSVKTQETHFSPLLLLDPHLIQVLNIVVDLVLLVLQLQAMMAQDERGPMMVVILEMMVEIL